MDLLPVNDSLLSRKIFRRFSGFSVIGVINTLIHLLVVTGMVELSDASAVGANCLAFVIANVFSFWANSRWNYGTPMTGRRFKRFFAVSIAGLMVTAGISAVASAQGWHYLAGTALVFVTLPVLTFIAHQKWTWAE